MVFNSITSIFAPPHLIELLIYLNSWTGEGNSPKGLGMIQFDAYINQLQLTL